MNDQAVQRRGGEERSRASQSRVALIFAAMVLFVVVAFSLNWLREEYVAARKSADLTSMHAAYDRVILFEADSGHPPKSAQEFFAFQKTMRMPQNTCGDGSPVRLAFSEPTVAPRTLTLTCENVTIMRTL